MKQLVEFDSNLAQLFPKVGSCASKGTTCHLKGRTQKAIATEMQAKKGVLLITLKLLVEFNLHLAKMFPRVGSCAYQVAISRGAPKGRP